MAPQNIKPHMAVQHTPPESASLNLGDVLFTLARHKWKILLFTLLGFGGAVAVYFLSGKVYQSDAKLLVRYVLERNAIDPVESQSNPGAARTGDNVINAEIDIITSWDLAVQVAEAVGIERLVTSKDKPATVEAAAAVVANGVEVVVPKGSKVIQISYKNQDPALAQKVLEELTRRYFDKHLEIHRSTGTFDFASQQTDQVRTRLRQIETRLKAEKEKAGVTNLTEGIAALNAQMAKTKEELLAAEANRAERAGRLQALEKGMSATAATNAPAAPAPAPVTSDVVQRYRALAEQLAALRREEAQLSLKFTPVNSVVIVSREQIKTAETQLQQMEKDYPALTTMQQSPSAPGVVPMFDPVAERAALVGFDARVTALKAQLVQLDEQMVRIRNSSADIEELERQKALEDQNYRYFESKREQARIDQALDPSKMPNISVVQKPSPAARVVGQTKKLMMGLAAGGLGLGLALAFALDLLLDRTLKRPVEVEKALRIPVMVSIPKASRSTLRLQNRRGKKGDMLALPGKGGGPSAMAPWDGEHFVRSYAEVLRDRLILAFEVKQLTHKPKLVAVTSMAPGEGASTLAGGLAASLSETGDGRVLLVDMKAGAPEMHSFFDGHETGSLTDVLKAGKNARPAGENLFLAGATTKGQGAGALPPTRFYDLIPTLRACDFDYVIFDMPPLEQSSAPLAMSRFMDKVLLVIEEGRSSRDRLEKMCNEFRSAGADVAAVFNKDRSSGEMVEGRMLAAF